MEIELGPARESPTQREMIRNVTRQILDRYFSQGMPEAALSVLQGFPSPTFDADKRAVFEDVLDEAGLDDNYFVDMFEYHLSTLGSLDICCLMLECHVTILPPRNLTCTPDALSKLASRILGLSSGSSNGQEDSEKLLAVRAACFVVVLARLFLDDDMVGTECVQDWLKLYVMANSSSNTTLEALVPLFNRAVPVEHPNDSTLEFRTELVRQLQLAMQASDKQGFIKRQLIHFCQVSRKIELVLSEECAESTFAREIYIEAVLLRLFPHGRALTRWFPRLEHVIHVSKSDTNVDDYYDMRAKDHEELDAKMRIILSELLSKVDNAALEAMADNRERAATFLLIACLLPVLWREYQQRSNQVLRESTGASNAHDPREGNEWRSQYIWDTPLAFALDRLLYSVSLNIHRTDPRVAFACLNLLPALRIHQWRARGQRPYPGPRMIRLGLRLWDCVKYLENDTLIRTRVSIGSAWYNFRSSEDIFANVNMGTLCFLEGGINSVLDHPGGFQDIKRMRDEFGLDPIVDLRKVACSSSTGVHKFSALANRTQSERLRERPHSYGPLFQDWAGGYEMKVAAVSSIREFDDGPFRHVLESWLMTQSQDWFLIQLRRGMECILYGWAMSRRNSGRARNRGRLCILRLLSVDIIRMLMQVYLGLALDREEFTPDGLSG